MNWIQRLLRGTAQRIEHAVESVTGIFRGKPDETGPVEAPPRPETVDYPVELIDPDELKPIEPDTGEYEDEPEDQEMEYNQDRIDEDTGLAVIEPGPDTRGPFATYSEALEYADEIPLPTTVGKTPYGLYIVLVVYQA